jgi:hypothetical protein
MDELFRRVQLLARLLRAVTSERANHIDPAIAAMELEWDASSLLAKFLENADVAHRTLDRAYVASVLDTTMLSQLEEPSSRSGSRTTTSTGRTAPWTI